MDLPVIGQGTWNMPESGSARREARRAIERGIGGCSTTALAATFGKNVPVYAYEFGPRSGPGWYTIAGYQSGAGHATELTYL